MSEPRTHSVNGRTHEPTIREIVAEFDGFKSLVMREFESRDKIEAEREKRYAQGEAANKEAVRAAFAAVEKVSAFNAESLAEYKKGANEWRDTVKDILSSTTGGKGQRREDLAQNNWMIGLVITVGLAAFGSMLSIVMFFLTKKP
jgi:hypothetical protein